MTDDEVLVVLEEMEKMFGTLPDPIHEPLRFAQCVKLYRYYIERNTR
jgi:hypothetical protein